MEVRDPRRTWTIRGLHAKLLLPHPGSRVSLEQKLEVPYKDRRSDPVPMEGGYSWNLFFAGFFGPQNVPNAS